MSRKLLCLLLCSLLLFFYGCVPVTITAEDPDVTSDELAPKSQPPPEGTSDPSLAPEPKGKREEEPEREPEPVPAQRGHPGRRDRKGKGGRRTI